MLIRHAESEKNTLGQFSSSSESERLTQRGELSASRLGAALNDIVSEKEFRVKTVYCTHSNRAIATAEHIADRLSRGVRSYSALRSTGAGALMGMTEREAATHYPQFLRELRLYRVGLFNAYHFTVAEGHEDKRDFECRVATCIDEILATPREDLKIVIAHRSSITATLLRCARESLGYPRSFYGYVRIDLGRVCWLEQKGPSDWCFHGINLDASDLLSASPTTLT